MRNIQEAELIAQSLNGDTHAYGELVDRYKNAVYYHCFAIVRDEAAAEDIAQETFVRAYYSLAKYNPDYRLSTWLFTISTNQCLSYIKKAKREVPSASKLLENVEAQNPSPQKNAEHAELHAAVDRLQPNYRAVISLYYWQGLNYAEVAQVMGVPLNSVRVWLKRAKEVLRKELT
ncbi:MAG TPA: RNA polymerase sigma factor [Candidatus Saccharimonadales bacterium]|nr:RNA polymerase sigma factor [Candidatus Saccharimonadales bacterium]